MTKADLIALAERCERAEGPSYALEREIMRAINPQATRYSIPKNYTASLDAAMTLVPEGYRLRLDIDETGRAAAALTLPGDPLPVWGEYLASAPIAVAAVSLRAHAALNQEKNNG